MLDSERSSHETDDNQARGQAQENGGAADSGAPAGVPGVLFQAPQVTFQPPAAPAAPDSGSSSTDQEKSPESGGGRGGRGSRGSRGGSASKSDGGSGKTGDSGKAADSGKTGDSGSAKAGDGESPKNASAKSGPAKGGDAEASADESGSRGGDDSGPDGSGDSDESSGGGRRRRRRNGRGRGRSGDGESVDAESAVNAADGDSEGSSASGKGDEDADDADESTSASRRRRRKRRRGGSGDDVTAPDDPPDTVVHVREQRNPADDVRAIKGSTRLEAKKQRRREGRESGRRRPPVITESEFLARRESVERQMVVRQRGDRTQIAVLEDDVLVEHYVNRTTHQSYVGNVYLGKVQNVLPSMEAAFVDIGKGRNAVLYAGEVNFDASGLEGQPKRIESALKPGQSVVVQVTKDPVGHKGARLTSQISLPGRYLVYVPGASMTGISRKLPDNERTRLKHILKKVMPENAGVIVRTAAEGAAEAELDRDVTRLAAQWESIEKKAKTASAPALLYGEPDLTVRVVRDVFNEDFSKLTVSGDEGWDTIDEYVRYVAPHLADRLIRWEDDEAESRHAPEDVFAAYRVDEQLAKALERKVWLPSGGSLVIDRTEAMTVVDVNTGKFTGQGGNLEETVTRNNLEAAEEIVRQLRLRDVGGIVVIDFIDMVLESNRELVLRRLLECLARDRTKHQVAEVTSLGLVQMTRKRVGAGLLEAFSQPCECCNGRGLHLTLEPAEPTHRSSAGHSGGSGGSRRSGRGSGGGTDTEDRPERERGGRRGKRGERGANAAAVTETATATLPEAESPETPSEVSEAPEKVAAVAEAPSSSDAPSSKAASSEDMAPEASATAPAPSAVKEAPARKRPSVAAWAVSTSSEEHAPVTVTVPVEPAVSDDSAKPARRRTRGGSARASVAAVVSTTPAAEAEAPVQAAEVAAETPEVPVQVPEASVEAPAAEPAEPVEAAEPVEPVERVEAVEAAEPVPAVGEPEAPEASETAPEPVQAAESADAAPAVEVAEVAETSESPEPAGPVAEQAEFAFDSEPAATPAPEPEAAAEPGPPAAVAEWAAQAPAESEASVTPEPEATPEAEPEAEAEAAAEATPASAEEPPAGDGFPFWS